MAAGFFVLVTILSFLLNFYDYMDKKSFLKDN